MPRPINYYSFRLLDGDYVADKTFSDPYDDERIKSYDHMLYKALMEVFSEPCRLSRDQIKRDTIIKLLLEKNPALSEIFPSGNYFSILWIAVLGCYQNSAELLVRSGAKVNEYCYSDLDDFGVRKWSILHLLLRMYPSSWNERFIDLIVDHGANLQAQDYIKEAVLHVAVRQDRVRVVELLLEKGVNVDVIDHTGTTPLLLAVRFSQKTDEIVQLLLKYGADATVRDITGSNVLHYLSKAHVEHTGMARVLLEKGASLDDTIHENQLQPIHVSVIYRKDGLVKLFLDHGADVNARAASGITPVFFGASSHDPADLLALLTRGANIDLKMTDGTTALHAACNTCPFARKDNMLNIKILLSIGMDMHAENSTGKTPLLLASDRSTATVGSIRKMMLRELALRKARLMQPSIELGERIL